MGKSKSEKSAHKALFRKEEKLSKAIRKAGDAGNKKLRRQLENRYLKSYAPKYRAAYEANSKLKGNRQVSREKLLEIVSTLDPRTGTHEKVMLNYKLKKVNPGLVSPAMAMSGDELTEDFRPIMSFSIEHRANQQLVCNLLKATATVSPNQYAVVNGGRPAAAKAVMKNLSDGYDWVCETDISNCYLSINEEVIEDYLPLPRRVTRSVVASRHFNLAPGNLLLLLGGPAISEEDKKDLAPDVERLIAKARHGIPQGSIASPYVAEVLLAEIIAELPSDGRVVAYADNILVFAQTAEGAVSMKENLKSALMGHPAGPLWPQSKPVTHASDGFDFLGYKFSQNLKGVVVQPSFENICVFERKFDGAIEKVLWKAQTVNGGVKIDHFGGAKPDHLM